MEVSAIGYDYTNVCEVCGNVAYDPICDTCYRLAGSDPYPVVDDDDEATP